MKRLILVVLLVWKAHATTTHNQVLGVGGGLVLPGISQSINKLLPVGASQQDSYNDLNRDYISKYRAFRVIADEEFQYNCLDKINRKRSLHDSTRPLSLGYNFTKYTIERAHSILQDIEQQRDISKGRYPLGESFFYYYDPNRYRSADDAINTWYSESRNYNYNRPGFSAKTGGFTQLVWKSSRETSCAKIEYETREHYKTLFVCNFYPAGNVNGEFPYNVLPLRKQGGGGGRPDYDEDRPNRPGGGGGNRPGGGRPDYDEDRPNRPGGGGGNRPGGGRPDYDEDRPNRPGGGGGNRPGGGGGRPRPPYDEPDYDRPSRPGGGGGGYPTHPVRVTGSTEILVPLPSSGVVAQPQPEVQSVQQVSPLAPSVPAQAVLVAQVSPSGGVIATQPAQTLAAPTQYAAAEGSAITGQAQALPAAQSSDSSSAPQKTDN